MNVKALLANAKTLVALCINYDITLILFVNCCNKITIKKDFHRLNGPWKA